MTAKQRSASAAQIVNVPIGPIDGIGDSTRAAGTTGLFDDARLYEIETARHAEDVPYWERLVDELRPASVLELGCGTGRLLGPVTRRGRAHHAGFRLVGLDLSDALLEVAAERVGTDAELRDSVHLVRGDMSDFALDERFDLVIIAFNSLGFVVGADRQRRCLDAVRRHLAPGGRVAIDLIVPKVSYLAASERTSPVRLGEDLRDPAPGVARLLRYDTERYDPVRQVDDSVYTYELHHADGRIERLVRDVAWQMTFPNELELVFAAAGLRVMQRYGDYARSPFDRTSHLYLWVAGRAEDAD